MNKLDTGRSVQLSTRTIEAARYFAKHYGISPSHWGEAPGRVEFIGNHVDYNGGEVLGVAVNSGVSVVAAPRTDGKLVFCSEAFDGFVEVAVGHDARLSGVDSWVNYPLGVWRVLQSEFALSGNGWSLAVASNLPRGSGLSSSAALELATAYALLALNECTVEPWEVAGLCRRAENEFVGLPCGILDQAVSALGRHDALVSIQCATQEFTYVPLPKGSRFWIFQSGVHHKLAHSPYATRFEECRQAASLLRAHRPEREWLCQWETGEWEAYAKGWPVELRRRARHVISENERVRRMCNALHAEDWEQAGVLLYESHASSQHDFENSIPEIDFLVESLRKVPGISGARLTGGGFGGAVMAWGMQNVSKNQIQEILRAFAVRYGHEPEWMEVTAADGAKGGNFLS